MRPLLLTLLIAFSVSALAQPQIQLEVFATDIPHNPIGLVHCGDDRVFAVCQDGYIMIIDTDGIVSPVPFLDIDDRVESLLNAHGLLGVVFHPDYASNGYFYVNYINNEMNTVIARFSVSPADPNIADPASEMIMMTVDQPYNVHKGGDLHFGPDGMLYVPLGDGGVIPPGGAGDPDNRSQDPMTFLGKMLRLDVDGGTPYAIPADNPYADATDTLPEIWAMGLRNPWRFSFDKLTGDMWLSDVGQDLWEEINVEPAGFTGGNNYGWRCYEAYEIYNPDSCDGAVDFTFPVHVYPHNDSTGGYSITGGYVYRGDEYPGLIGKYMYCDYVTGNFYTLEPDGAGGWLHGFYPALLFEAVSFGEDVHAEQYVVVRATATIYKVTDACAGLNLTSSMVHADCILGNTGSITVDAADGVAPYTYVWSTGDTLAFIDSLAPGTYSVIVTDSIGCNAESSFDVEMSGEFNTSYTLSGDTILVEFIADASYVWYFDGMLLPDATANTLVPDSDGVYLIIITNAFGCTDTLEVFYTSVFISNPAVAPHMEIIPNPAADHILIALQEGTEISIYAASGQEMHRQVLSNDAVDISTFPAGLYFVRGCVYDDCVTGSFVRE